MKKPTTVMLIVGLLCSSVFPLKMGLEFQTGGQSTIGANLRLSDKFELKPQLGFMVSDPLNSFSLRIDGNFYIADSGELQHYVGANIHLMFISGKNLKETIFGPGGHYGIRYDLNDVLSVFGQLGLHFDLTHNFFMSTNTSGVGLTFNILDK